MVWIRQVVDQEVNLFEGPQLVATSQRDLFESGLLPTRTPAAVYREVVLRRRPVHVGEDRIGAFRYLVAAAPIPGLGRDAVLSVPIASRQREIEREIDELTRGVLAGAVVVILFAAALGASVAARVSDPVARLTRATRLIAEGRLDERLVADSADELGRLVADFNTMTEMLASQRDALARANQLQAWAEMSRQVAHEVKNPLTPIQLAAEHLARVHEDQGRPLGPVFDQCVSTILLQVRLLRRIASEFSTYAAEPTLRIEVVDVPALLAEVLAPYRPGLSATTSLEVDAPSTLPPVRSRSHAARSRPHEPRRERAAGHAVRRAPADRGGSASEPVARPGPVGPATPAGPAACDVAGERHRRRHGRGRGPAGVRALLLHKDERIGIGACECEADGGAMWRHDCGRECAGPRHHDYDDAAGRPSRRARQRVIPHSMNADDK